MANDFKGVIIAESLEKKDVLNNIKIITTKIEKVTPEHKTPYLKKWTLHTVEIPEAQADEIAEELSSSLDSSHGDWYADFNNDYFHYIIFYHKVFKIERSKPEQYKKAVKYGLSLGIPEYQLEFTSF